MGKRGIKAWMALATALPLGVPHLALAGGFEVGVNGSRAVARGGAFTARADDLTAIEHNPAGLVKLRGTHVLLSHNTVHAPMKFTRAPSQIAGSSTATVKSTGATVNALDPQENQTPWFALGGQLVAASDFGLKDWTFAVGVYGPSGSGHQEWSVNGGQRYMLTALDVLLVYYSLAAAWGKQDHYGFGATLQLAHQPRTNLSLVLDGTTGDSTKSDLAPFYSTTDVESTISLAAPPAPTAILGAWWRPIPSIELAASGRVAAVQLHGKGDISLRNTPTGAAFTQDKLAVPGESARLDLVIPPTAKLGARYRHLDGDQERFDVELDLVYEAWSMLEQYDVRLTGQIKLFADKKAPEHVIIAKAWRDTVAARLGGTYRVKDTPLSISAGTYVENGATPNNYSHIDFASFNRLGLSGGVHADVGPAQLSLAYMHVFQETRTVSETYGKVYQQRPVAQCPQDCPGPDGVHYDGVPANAGTFVSSYDILSASVQVGF